MFLCASVQAAPLGLPDSARPGAVRPEQEEAAKVPQAGTTEVLEIPAVIDRPLSVAECPCVIVKEFRLLNAEDMPRFGIKVADVQKILEEKQKQQPEQGYSIGQLQEIANDVRTYYRDKGLILALVTVPVQTVQGGVVDMELFIGRLGRVLVEGNKMYSSETLARPFRDLIGKPINKADIEATLLRLTDYAGLTIFGVFQPGQEVGTADIVLKTQKEKRFDVALRIDDHGTRETGQNRFRTTIDWNSPTGADKLSGTVQQSYDPKNNEYESLEYKHFLFDGSYTATAFFNHNAFDVGGKFASSQIHSISDQKSISLAKSFIRSRIENIAGKLTFKKETSATTTAGAHTNQDNLSVFILGLDYDSVDQFNPFRAKEGGGGINFATVEFSQGVNNFLGAMGSSAEASLHPTSEQPSRANGNGTQFAAGQFTKFFGTITRLQTVRKNISLLLRADLQWSPNLLVPLEQYSVGGPDNVRAFPPAQVLWDKALMYSAEFMFNAPFFADKPSFFANRTWGEILQVGIFYDSATGRVNSPTPSEKSSYDTLNGAGFSLRFNLPGSIESRVFTAWEFGGGDVTNHRHPNIWGDLTYSF